MFEGRPKEAIPYFRRAVEISQAKGYSMKDLIAGLIKVGEKEEAQGLIDQLQKGNQSNLIGPAGWCYIYSLAGDLDKAFMFLEKGIKEKDFWVFTIKYSQDWDEMRDDPRFDKFLKRMNYPG
jgi:tetratricopeptide (TPR) repeat protein